jgi:hypothetical protein
LTNYQLKASSGNIHWAGHLLDAMVAPECSTLTSCDVPELPEPTNYFGSFFLNNIFSAEPDRARPLIVVFLRRYAQAVREYRVARETTAEYIAALPQTNNVTDLYLRSLSHFEQAIINLYLALMASKSIAQLIVPGTEDPFRSNDGSPAAALYELYSAIKHFDSRIVKGLISGLPAPVWIVSDGLKCSKVKTSEPIKLSFVDMIALYNELGSNAEFLSEGVYQFASQRRADQIDR